MKCEICDIEHQGNYGSGRFCTLKCARSFSTLFKRDEINKKVSEKLKRTRQKTCKGCGKLFISDTRRKSLCSNECKRLSKSIAGKKSYNTRILNGTHSGWKSRLGKLPSYPEQYFIDLFLNEGYTDYVRELPFKKWFIDFAFQDRKIAIEIDGKQHRYRKDKDKEKDKDLTEDGWIILRIDWFNPATEKGKNLLYPQIKKMKELLSVM
jgi:very-short-patch-repair endonuclease